MIPWTTIKPGLLVLVKALTGLEQAEWFDKTRPFVGGAQLAIALLTHTATRRLGLSHESVFAPADPLVPEDPWYQTTTQSQIITIRICVETYNQADDATAENYLSRMRDRLPQLSYVESFRAIGLGVSEFLPFVDLSDTRDNRRASVGACDLLLNLGSSDTDPTPYDMIETLDDPVLL